MADRKWKVQRDENQDCFVRVVNKEGHIICETMLKEAAPLLAAAPELLEALKCARMEAPKKRRSAPFWIGVDELIAKAEAAPNNDTRKS